MNAEDQLAARLTRIFGPFLADGELPCADVVDVEVRRHDDIADGHSITTTHDDGSVWYFTIVPGRPISMLRVA